MAIVHLSGNVDRRTVPDARRHVFSGLQLGGPALHVDLGEVAWIDSAGLAVLVEAAQQARHAGLKVHLHRVGDPVMKMIRLAHLDGIFSIFRKAEAPTLH
ncbi:MAG: STAS domain-containing protein [Rhodospirillaceae bacterium]